MSSTTLDVAFDVPNEEGTPPIKLLPAGKYTAAITNAIVGPTKNGRGQSVSLTWSISDGEFEKRLVFQNILIDHDTSEDARRIGRQKFKDVCVSCGITEPLTELEKLLYKDCQITVTIRVDKEGQYPDKNEVRNVLPVSKWDQSPIKDNITPIKSTAQSLKEASTMPKAFEAVKADMDDEIPF
jgi:hypothetical protein